MEQGLVFVIFGWIATVSMILGYLPQAIQTIRTRNTDGIALPTFLMMGIGSFSFMMQGLLHTPNVLWSLFLTNFITTVCSCIVFGIKVYNDYFKKNNNHEQETYDPWYFGSRAVDIDDAAFQLQGNPA